MDLEGTFHGLLGLDERWDVCGIDYDEQEERFFVVIRETGKLWPAERCPEGACGSEGITCHDHTETRAWRHLDVFGKRADLLCNVPRGRCPRCRKVYRVKVPWEGRGKHFTTGFEGFALALLREMPVSKAAEIVQETDQRMWRMLFAHVDAAYGQLDLSEVTWIGADEMSTRKGHHYLTVFADLLARRVIFATEGKDAQTFAAFVKALGEHNGHAKAITQAAIDMSPAYQKGVRENLPNAQVVFDKYHVIALVNAAVEEVRRAEARQSPQSRQQLKGSRWVIRKNPANLSKQQQEQLAGLDLANLATGMAYQMRLNLQAIYRSRSAQTARRRFSNWSRWVERKARKLGALLQPMARVAKTVTNHQEGILAHWQQGLTTAFLEGLNSVFSAVKRKARGYRSTVYMITVLYLVAGKLKLPAPLTH